MHPIIQYQKMSFERQKLPILQDSSSEIDIFKGSNQFTTEKKQVVNIRSNIQPPTMFQAKLQSFMKTKDNDYAHTGKRSQQDDIFFQHFYGSMDHECSSEKDIHISMEIQHIPNNMNFESASPSQSLHNLPEPNEQTPLKQMIDELSRVQLSHNQASISPMQVVKTVEKKEKKDKRRNMYGHSFKTAVEACFSIYKSILRKKCAIFGVDSQQVKQYYQPQMKHPISLKKARNLLNYKKHEPGSIQRKIKKTFLKFYVWYMRTRYPLHIIKSDDIKYKQQYIKASSRLVYLPNIKEEKVKVEEDFQFDLSIDEQ